MDYTSFCKNQNLKEYQFQNKPSFYDMILDNIINSDIAIALLSTASRTVTYLRESAVQIGFVASATAIISSFGLKVLKITRSFYSLLIDRDETDLKMH